MKKLAFYIFIMTLAISPILHAKEKDQVQLDLPWDQLQQLLRLNKDEVRLSWAEFQNLSQRTTTKAVPKFAMSGGDVVLTRDEFKRLVESLIPPPADPSTTFITQGTYKAHLVGDSVVVAAILNLQIDKKDDKPLRIDLFPGHVAFGEITLDDRPALTTLENGRLYLTTRERGRHTAKLQFSIRNPNGDKNQRVSFPIQRTSITKLEFEIPEPNLDMSVTGALKTETQGRGGASVVTAVLPPSYSVDVAWHAEVPEAKKGPAKIYVDENHLVSIEEDALRVRTIVNVQVLQNSINSLTVEVPKNFSVIDVQGESLKEWSEAEAGLVRIPFDFARQGSFQVVITGEQILPENKTDAVFTGFKVRGATREKGYVGVELRTTAEASTAEALPGLERVDIQELPAELVALSQRPLLFGFKYLRYPFDLGLRVERHADVQVLTSVIDSAYGVTSLTDDGKMVHQVTYRLRNTWKQFLEVKLPEKARLWSVFVGGQPVKPSENAEGKLLIPLNRSQNVGGALRPFDVEIVYYEAAPTASLIGRRTFRFPIPDMIVAQISWSVVVPSGHAYGYFGHDLQKTSPPGNITEVVDGEGSQSVADGVGLDDFRMNLVKNERDFRSQIASAETFRRNSFEQQVAGKSARNENAPFPAAVATPKEELAYDRVDVGGSRVAGVLPVRAEIPLTGEWITFTKDLIVKDVPIQLPLYYVSDGLITIAKVLLIALLAFAAFRVRRAIEIVLRDLASRATAAAAVLKRWSLTLHRMSEGGQI